MNNNERLLQVYMAGFKDCPDGVNNRNNFLLGREQTAYSLGWWDYVAGDDNPTCRVKKKYSNASKPTTSKSDDTRPNAGD